MPAINTEIMEVFNDMKDLQTILAMLDRDPKCGKLLPTAQLVQLFQDARPLGSKGLAILAQVLDACTEQMYEYYRPLTDLFREEILAGKPDEKTIQTGIALGILDDEEWENEKWN